MNPTFRLPRRGQLLLLLFLGSALPGCSAKWISGRLPFRRTPPCQFNETVAVPVLLEHLNRSRAGLQSWQSTDCSVTVSGTGQIPLRLSASISARWPREFRLIVHSFKGVEADLGSNSEQIWFWVPSFRPEIMTAHQSDAVALLDQHGLPIQSAWLLQVLGFVPFEENRFEIERHEPGSNRITMVQFKPLEDGRLLEHAIVIDTCRGRVLEHQLSDRQGRLLARAELSRHEIVNGFDLPHRVKLHWPLAKQVLTLNLNQLDVNPSQLNQQIFAFPSQSGAPIRNLTAHGQSGSRSEVRNVAADSDSAVGKEPPFADASRNWTSPIETGSGGDRESSNLIPAWEVKEQPEESGFEEIPPFANSSALTDEPEPPFSNPDEETPPFADHTTSQPEPEPPFSEPTNEEPPFADPETSERPGSTGTDLKEPINAIVPMDLSKGNPDDTEMAPFPPWADGQSKPRSLTGSEASKATPPTPDPFSEPTEPTTQDESPFGSRGPAAVSVQGSPSRKTLPEIPLSVRTRGVSPRDERRNVDSSRSAGQQSIQPDSGRVRIGALGPGESRPPLPQINPRILKSSPQQNSSVGITHLPGLDAESRVPGPDTERQ